MQVVDIGTISRLERAKQLIGKLSSLTPLPIWLSIFSWESQKLIPISSERELLLTVLPSLDEKNLVLQGSDIKRALKTGISQFSWDIQSGTLVVFTDGGSDVPNSILEIQKELQEKHIKIILVGIGTKRGWPIVLGTDPFGREIYKTYKWDRVISILETDKLKKIATQLWAIYIDDVAFENELEKLFSVTGFSSKWWYTYVVFLSFFFWIGYVSSLTFLKLSTKRVWI
jgi:Ca-activated chloride channel homolog